jgi:hypothetical protein
LTKPPTPCRSLRCGLRIGPSRSSCRTLPRSKCSPTKADPFHLQDLNAADTEPHGNEASSEQRFLAPSALQLNRRFGRSKTMGAPISTHISVAVVAPGGGTGINSSVYASLGRQDGFSVNIIGQSRAPYDRYPTSWATEGAPPPNLETFAMDLQAQNCFDKADCLVFGSRGGQVVLPTLWNVCGAAIPPAIVINGGCAMGLPIPVRWPELAVTFLLLGGNDYFRGQMPENEYIADAQRRVPRASTSTAVLFVREMSHMPQAQLLTSILPTMIRAVTSWKSLGDPPLSDFCTLLASLRKGGWSGSLSYKVVSGDGWEVESFP